jgi:hypothetical protein
MMRAYVILEELLKTHHLLPKNSDPHIIRISVQQFVQLLSNAGRHAPLSVPKPGGVVYEESRFTWTYTAQTDRGPEGVITVDKDHPPKCYVGQFLKEYVVDAVMKESRADQYWLFEPVPPMLEKLREHARRSSLALYIF